MNKILVINLTRMGDILQSTPLLKAVRRKHPQAQIHYLVVQSFADVCRLIPEIDRIVPFFYNTAVAASKSAIKLLPRRLKEVETFIDSLRNENYDQVINLSHSRISALICHLLNVPDTRGLTLDREGFRQILHPWGQYFFTANLNRSCNRFNLVDVHMGLAFDSDDFRQPVRKVWNPSGDNTLSVEIPPDAHLEATRLLQNWSGKDAPLLVGFQPGASLPSKCWPPDSFIELGKILTRQSGAGIVIFGSQAERDRAEGIAQALGSSAINLAGKTSLPALAALLGRLNLLVSNDTGTQHLAVAVGIPVLSLCFGSALSHETGPYGPGHIVVESTLPCYPCSFHVECRRFRCQEQVGPESVARLASDMLNGGNAMTNGGLDGWKDLNVWRTDFDDDGFWILRPVVKRPLTAEALINLTVRKIWKDLLIGRDSNNLGGKRGLAALARDLEDFLPPEPESLSTRLRECLNAFTRLKELAETGESQCLELERLTIPPVMDGYQGIQAIADDLARLDREISLIGANLPAVNHFVLDFIFGKQNLEGRQVNVLAQRTGQLYHRLADGASRFQSLLQGWEEFLNYHNAHHTLTKS